MAESDRAEIERLQRLCEELRRRDEARGELELRLERLEAKIDAMKRSVGWKLTSPLREIGRVTDRLLGRGALHPSKRARRRGASPEEFPLAERPLAEGGGAGPASLGDLVRTLPAQSEIAIVVHLFYPEVWERIAAHLDTFPEPFDLFVSMPEGPERAPLAEAIALRFPSVCVKSFENRGRDIRPFLAMLREERLAGYRYVCKLHTKRSGHLRGGQRWSDAILADLLGAEAAWRILARFRSDPAVGLVGPADSRLTEEPFWGDNRYRVTRLAEAMGLAPDSVPLDFFAGSMFWARPEALDPLLRALGERDDFPPEAAQLDGTLAHAIERAFSLSAMAAGFRVDGAEASVPATSR